MPLNKEKIVDFPSVIPFDKQGVPVPGTKRPGQTAHYRNGIWGLIDESVHNSFLTLDEVFADGLKPGRNRPFLGYRPIVSRTPLKFADHYEWLTWDDVDKQRQYIGSALHAIFKNGEVKVEDYETVGVWSQNRPEWQIIEIACQTYNKVTVSLYDTLGKDAVEYIINHATTSVVFATSDHVPTLLRLSSKTPCVKRVIIIDTIPVEAVKVLMDWGQSVGIKVQEWNDLQAFGKANFVEPIKPTPDTVATICYTSGTTSNPKGVILKHRTLGMATTSNMYGIALPDDGILMSYLPLAHIYERICELCTIACGGRIGYFSGDPLRLLEDAQILKPNFFPSVPRVLNRVYQAAMTGGNVPGLKGKIFNKAVQTKTDKLRTTGQYTHPLWDKIVFRKIQAVLGGQIKYVTTGSAPISADVMDFLKIAFACQVDEGTFGMTECAATCTKTWVGDTSSSGTVGGPQPGNEIKLVDVPSMGYTSEDEPNPRGELCIRGTNIFTEYYKDPKGTREALDEEGWLHSGDIAEIDSKGRVKIIDRVKNIMKLAQGEYVAVENIENLHSSNPIISQIFVYGDSLQSYLVAVVIPEPMQLSMVGSRILGKKLLPDNQGHLEEAIKDPRINAYVLSELMKDAKKYGFRGFETVKRIHLTLKQFTVENGTLTPTMKIKRKAAAQLFQGELGALYALGEPQSASVKL